MLELASVGIHQGLGDAVGRFLLGAGVQALVYALLGVLEA